MAPELAEDLESPPSATPMPEGVGPAMPARPDAGLTSPAPGVPSPGPTSPAAVGVQQNGNVMRSRLLVGVAMSFLDTALALASSKSDEGQTILSMLNAGKKLFGKPAKDLGAGELKLAASRLNPATEAMGGPPMGPVAARAGQLGLGMPRGPYGPRQPQPQVPPQTTAAGTGGM